jgi:DNA polymerase-3 subunit alpha
MASGVSDPGFIHLRVHSAYSLSAGAIKSAKLPSLCRTHAMPAIAQTDTGNLFGGLEFSVASAGEGIQPIIGCELGIRSEDRERLGRPEKPAPIVLLAQTERGYFNLVKLVSKSYMETAPDEPPQVALADLETLSEGLICLSGGAAGPVGRALLVDRKDAAAALLSRLASIFPDRLYVEIQRHGAEAEALTEPGLIDLAYALDLPLVATNDVHFATRDFSEAHDVLLCIADGTTMAYPARRRLTEEHYFKSAAEMRALFADLPEACDNSVVIARRCSFVLKKVKPVLPPFTDGTGRGEDELLRDMALTGLRARLERQVLPQLAADQTAEAVERQYRERLDYELGIISRMGYSGYYLIVADFIQWAKNNGIPVGPGRGSGAGSVVAWVCTITDVDPIRLNLLFERFLNPERVSMPDFDVDFCQERRGEVLDYVQQKYGRDKVAQIITFGKLQARAVLRDVGRVLGMPYMQVDRICKLVPNNPASPVTLQQAVDGDEQLRVMRDGDEAVARLMALAMKLEGLYRHASTHAAGVVIGGRPLDELVALYRDPRSDMPVTQFNMKYVEDAGLVKFDFLGLKTLTVVDHAVKLVNQRGTALDLVTLPLDDAKTFEMLVRGETVGVFQFEGAGMRDLHRKLKPTKFEDLIAVVSLFRPGPMDSIPEYIAVKHGTQAADYMHPAIREILEETYGVMTYQEQVMQIAQVLAGYTLGGADLLRRAMGKKIKAEMDAQRKLFQDGAAERGVAADTASLIFDKMAKFAGYGFNKCHAAPYALVAYQTAYLKANHPVEFLAASMTLDLGNTDKLNLFRQELQRIEVPLLPVDINRSDADFTVEGEGDSASVRYALAAVKGVGAAAMKAVEAERKANGPFRDLFDFAERLDTRQFNKRQFESLAKAGAFDSLNPNRAAVLAAADMLMRYAVVAAEQRGSDQIGLFGGEGEALAKPRLPSVPDFAPADRLQHEFEAIGFYLSAHPLDPYAAALKRLGVIPAARIADQRGRAPGGRIKLAGIVLSHKVRTSAQGKRFAFVQMSDLSGAFEVTLFSEVLATSRGLLEAGQPLLLAAEAKAEGGDAVKITVHSIELLADAATGVSAGLSIRLRDAASLGPLRSILGSEQRNEERRGGKLHLVVEADEREVELALPGQFSIGAAMRAAIRAVPGVLDVQDF